MSNSGWLLARAVRGPLLLITLGALFALDQNGGTGFHRTWPILLVVFGVLKLIERLLAPAVAPPGPPSWPPPPGTPGAWTQPPPGGYRR